MGPATAVSYPTICASMRACRDRTQGRSSPPSGAHPESSNGGVACCHSAASSNGLSSSSRASAGAPARGRGRRAGTVSPRSCGEGGSSRAAAGGQRGRHHAAALMLSSASEHAARAARVRGVRGLLTSCRHGVRSAPRCAPADGSASSSRLCPPGLGTAQGQLRSPAT